MNLPQFFKHNCASKWCYFEDWEYFLKIFKNYLKNREKIKKKNPFFNFQNIFKKWYKA